MPTPIGSAERVKKIRAHVYISGKVQGVYFRQNTLIVSERSGIMGWVRNLNDGRVEALFEGNERDVNKVIEWCHTGPPKAVVEYVNVNYEKYTGEFQDFRIS
jgi:acylphosphatase